jgi:hypothetical protein
MKLKIAVLWAIAFLLAATPALAGVTITQQRKTTGGAKNRTFSETTWVQGHKSKVVLYQGAIITDLDAGKMYQLDLVHKRYTEEPFPPTGQMGEIFARSEGMFNFKKTGTSRKIASYSCDDYTGSIKAPDARYTTTECVSSSAPGAHEFSEYRSALAAKLKSAGLTPSSISIPPGIPLAVDSTTEILASRLPKGKKFPNEGVEIQQALAKRHPQESKTEVSKIEVTDLPPETFTVPPSFKANARRVSPPVIVKGKTGESGAQPTKP